MLNVVSGYSELCLEMVPGFSECATLYYANLLVQSVFAAGHIAEETWDAIIAGGGIIVKVDELFPGKSCHLMPILDRIVSRELLDIPTKATLE